MAEDKIQAIERHVRLTMSAMADSGMRLAHDFQHIDRVRRWALRIARGEGGVRLDQVEAAALLHDIGLSRVQGERRGAHAAMGAEMASQFLTERQLFTNKEVAEIAEAIRCHSSARGGGRLGEILRDADKLDALGAVGIMRAYTSKYDKPEYDLGNVKGETWGLTMAEFEHRFAAGKGIGSTIVDQINFQISFYSDLHTDTARQLGKPLVEYMRAFVAELDRQVHMG